MTDELAWRLKENRAGTLELRYESISGELSDLSVGVDAQLLIDGSAEVITNGNDRIDLFDSDGTPSVNNNGSVINIQIPFTAAQASVICTENKVLSCDLLLMNSATSEPFTNQRIKLATETEVAHTIP